LAPGALPERLMAGALVALLCNFGLQAASAARGVRAAATNGGDDALAARALHPWLALKLAGELGGAVLAATTRRGCAGATLVVCVHLLYDTLPGARINNYGSVDTLCAQQRRRLLAAGAALSVLGGVACAASAAGPLPAPAVALAASATFTAATSGWVLWRTGLTVFERLLEAAFGGQRC
jgi:hypothetical protein